jgi:hypothetical protein
VETNKGVIQIGAVNSETTEQVSVVVADCLWREKSFRELRAVIHADVGVSAVKEVEAKHAMTNAHHAPNTGVSAMEVKRFCE